MTTAVKASDLIPGLYDGNDVDDNMSDDEVELEQLYEDNADGTVEIDVFNMVAFNHNGLRDGKENTMLEAATRNSQLVVKELFSLPVEMTDEGPVVTLPAPTTILPRSQRIPDMKPQTKWEKFAAQKGIQNKKKERMIWDDERQMYLPRYGYQRKKEGIWCNVVLYSCDIPLS
jgi:hypothetical protein